MYTCIYIYIGLTRAAGIEIISRARPSPSRRFGPLTDLSLYTILSSPILYGVWHINSSRGGGSYIAQSRAIVLH